MLVSSKPRHTPSTLVITIYLSLRAHNAHVESEGKVESERINNKNNKGT